MQVITLTVFANIIRMWFASTEKTVTLLNIVCTEYIGGRKVVDKEKKLWLGHCKHWNTVDLGGQKLKLSFFAKHSASIFLPRIDDICYALHCKLAVH